MRTTNSISPLAQPEGTGAAGTESGGPVCLLKLNFRNARLGIVVSYLRQSTGLLIQNRCSVAGEPTVNLWRAEPVSAAEALSLLSQVLLAQGWMLIQKGRLLSIIGGSDLKKTCIPLPCI